MKILEQEFDSRGFHFKILKRDGMLAVLEKTSTNGYKGFETIRIRSHNGYSIAGVNIPPAESLPNSESWGTDGFSYQWDEKEKAFSKMEWMKKQFAPQLIDNQGIPIKKSAVVLVNNCP